MRFHDRVTKICLKNFLGIEGRQYDQITASYLSSYLSLCDLGFFSDRCLLAARSSFLLDSLLTRWHSKQIVSLRHDRVNPEVFNLMLKFLYIGRIDIPQELIDELKKLAMHCKLSRLLGEIDAAEEKVMKLVHLKPSMEEKVKILTVGSDDSSNDLRADLRELAESCLPVPLRSWIDEGVLPFYYESISYFPDICVEVENLQFYCHQVFLCSHSDFFKALISDHFDEHPKPTSKILTVRLQHLSAEIFRHVIIYVYSGKAEFKHIDETLEVLVTADMILLLGLKKLCGGILSDSIAEGNVVDLFQCSQIYKLPNLEDRCTTFLANSVENFVECEEFMNLVTEQAHQVQAREEIDSIPIVDDIRHCITNSATTMGEIAEANSKLAKLDSMLARLGIEC